MPSIYNHENTCWGIRRSSPDMFQYDLNEFQSNTSRELGCKSSQSTNAPYVQYSVSSNGYYGYQPHQAAPAVSNTEVSMDVEDMDVTQSPNSNLTINNNSSTDCAYVHPDPTLNILRRKRQMTCDSSDGPKRSRQEGKISYYC